MQGFSTLWTRWFLATNTLHRSWVTFKKGGGVTSWEDLRRKSLWLEEEFWTKFRLGLDLRVGTETCADTGTDDRRVDTWDVLFWCMGMLTVSCFTKLCLNRLEPFLGMTSLQIEIAVLLQLCWWNLHPFENSQFGIWWQLFNLFPVAFVVLGGFVEKFFYV